MILHGVPPVVLAGGAVGAEQLHHQGTGAAADLDPDIALAAAGIRDQQRRPTGVAQPAAHGRQAIDARIGRQVDAEGRPDRWVGNEHLLGKILMAAERVGKFLPPVPTRNGAACDDCVTRDGAPSHSNPPKGLNC